jgi:hypothetical protein
MPVPTTAAARDGQAVVVAATSVVDGRSADLSSHSNGVELGDQPAAGDFVKGDPYR